MAVGLSLTSGPSHADGRGAAVCSRSAQVVPAAGPGESSSSWPAQRGTPSIKRTKQGCSPSAVPHGALSPAGRCWCPSAVPRGALSPAGHCWRPAPPSFSCLPSFSPLFTQEAFENHFSTSLLHPTRRSRAESLTLSETTRFTA